MQEPEHARQICVHDPHSPPPGSGRSPHHLALQLAQLPAELEHHEEAKEVHKELELHTSSVFGHWQQKGTLWPFSGCGGGGGGGGGFGDGGGGGYGAAS